MSEFKPVEDEPQVKAMTKEEQWQLITTDVEDDRKRLFWQVVVPMACFIYLAGLIIINAIYN